MFIQGELQAVFDALYAIGAVEPVLEMDWETIHDEIQRTPSVLGALVEVVNGCQSDPERLRTTLHKWDRQSLNYLAIEVAREYAEFQDRNVLH